MTTWRAAFTSAFAACVLASPLDAAAQAPGEYVKVEGHAEAGTFRAERVVLRDRDPQSKIEGAITATSNDRGQLTLLDFEVVIDAGTRLYRGSQPSRVRSMLARGAWIEAKGMWQGDVLRATRIRVKTSAEPTEEIEGLIESVDAGSKTLVILGRTILIPARVTIADERSAEPGAASRLRRDDDDGDGRRQPLAMGRMVVGGRLEAGYLNEGSFNDAASSAERTLLSRLQVLASSQLTDSIEAYAKATLTRNMVVGSGADAEARLSEAYLLFHRIGGSPFSLQLGRQRFRDSREWFFDEYLDAARVRVTLPRVTLDTAVAKGLLAGPPDQRRRREQLHLINSATVHGPAGVQISGYLIARRDVTRGERPVWIGGAISGAAGPGWTYWGDAAVRRGAAGATPLRGWAASGGATRRWARAWSPSLTLAAAAASGDATPGDGTDSRFRQTDLEDNQAYFGGLRRLAIYGEVLDPELSNLRVATVAFGVRPRQRIAVDAIYHFLMQDAAGTSLPSSNLAGALTGLHRHLGHEVNGVLTVRARAGLDLDLTAGVFVPGPAFAGHPGPAFFWRPQLRFYF